MNVFDWLSNMDMPVENRFDVIEVRFKNGRKDFFRLNNVPDVVTGDAVLVEVPNGHHLGYVSLMGELVRLQMKKRSVEDAESLNRIYRKASLKDLEKFEKVKNRELPTLFKTREIIRDQKLEMKLTDVEFQADNSKATFYYSADGRVDFRELIKVLAGEFKIRVEMRQISLRQEAGRLGGIGSCGRELCCSTWLTDFKTVSTSAARYQSLSLNPTKLSGQCGRLKCCLNYELETYMEALEDIPEVKGTLKTAKGEASLQKTDIFRKIMWFGYKDESTWHPLDIERVNHIIAMNAREEVPATLLEDVEEVLDDDQALNRDLELMDKKYSMGRKKKRRSKGKGGNKPKASTAKGSQPAAKTAEGTKENKPRRRSKGGRPDGRKAENKTATKDPAKKASPSAEKQGAKLQGNAAQQKPANKAKSGGNKNRRRRPGTPKPNNKNQPGKSNE